MADRSCRTVFLFRDGEMPAGPIGLHPLPDPPDHGDGHGVAQRPVARGVASWLAAVLHIGPAVGNPCRRSHSSGVRRRTKCGTASIEAKGSFLSKFPPRDLLLAIIHYGPFLCKSDALTLSLRRV